MEYLVRKPNELYHYGTLGMKWGIRKYQYADGSLTPAGKIRYLKLKGNLNNAPPEDIKKRKYRKMREDLVMLVGNTTLKEISKSKEKDPLAQMTREEWLRDMKNRTYALRVENQYLEEKNNNIEKNARYQSLTHPTKPKKRSALGQFVGDTGYSLSKKTAEGIGEIGKGALIKMAKEKGWIDKTYAQSKFNKRPGPKQQYHY